MAAKMELDVASLSRFLSRSGVPGYHGKGLVATKYPNGQSNPTFLVEEVDAAGRVLGRWVLRRKPMGVLLPSAHAVDREFAFQRALRPAGVPVPLVHALCEDDSIIGSSFYVMEHCEGTIWKDPRLPECSPGRRGKIYGELARGLAKLHAVDASSLEGLPRSAGKRSSSSGGLGYGLRTLRRWKKQYLASCAAVREDPLDNMLYLAKYLEARVPAPSSSGADRRECILHGDFRLDNCICAGGSDEIKAILDWELATVGTRDQALADVAYCCLPYYLPPTVLAIQTLTVFCKET